MCPRLNRHTVILLVVVKIINSFHKHSAIIDFICQRILEKPFDYEASAVLRRIAFK